MNRHNFVWEHGTKACIDRIGEYAYTIGWIAATEEKTDAVCSIQFVDEPTLFFSVSSLAMLALLTD